MLFLHNYLVNSYSPIKTLLKCNLLKEVFFIPLPLLHPVELFFSPVISLYHIHAYIFVIITVFGVLFSSLADWFGENTCFPHQSDFPAGRSNALLHLCIPHAQLSVWVKTSI